MRVLKIFLPVFFILSILTILFLFTHQPVHAQFVGDPGNVDCSDKQGDAWCACVKSVYSSVPDVCSPQSVANVPTPQPQKSATNVDTSNSFQQLASTFKPAGYCNTTYDREDPDTGQVIGSAYYIDSTQCGQCLPGYIGVSGQMACNPCSNYNRVGGDGNSCGACLAGYEGSATGLYCAAGPSNTEKGNYVNPGDRVPNSDQYSQCNADGSVTDNNVVDNLLSVVTRQNTTIGYCAWGCEYRGDSVYCKPAPIDLLNSTQNGNTSLSQPNQNASCGTPSTGPCTNADGSKFCFTNDGYTLQNEQCVIDTSSGSTTGSIDPVQCSDTCNSDGKTWRRICSDGSNLDNQSCPSAYPICSGNSCVSATGVKLPKTGAGTSGGTTGPIYSPGNTNGTSGGAACTNPSYPYYYNGQCWNVSNNQNSTSSGSGSSSGGGSSSDSGSTPTTGTEPLGAYCGTVSDCNPAIKTNLSSNQQLACVNNMCAIQSTQQDANTPVSNTNCDNGIDCTSGGTQPNAVCIGSGTDHAHAYCLATPNDDGYQCNRDQECKPDSTCKTDPYYPQYKICTPPSGQVVVPNTNQTSTTTTGGTTNTTQTTSGTNQNPANGTGQTNGANQGTTTITSGGGGTDNSSYSNSTNGGTTSTQQTPPQNGTVPEGYTCTPPASGQPNPCQNSADTCASSVFGTTTYSVCCPKDPSGKQESWGIAGTNPDGSVKGSCVVNSAANTPSGGTGTNTGGNLPSTNGSLNCQGQTHDVCVGIYQWTSSDQSSPYYNGGLGKCTWDKATTDGTDGCFPVHDIADKPNQSCVYGAICPTGQSCVNGKCSGTTASSGGNTNTGGSNYTNNTSNSGGTIAKGYDCSQDVNGCQTGLECSSATFGATTYRVCCPPGQSWGNDPVHPGQGACVTAEQSGTNTNNNTNYEQSSQVDQNSPCTGQNYNNCVAIYTKTVNQFGYGQYGKCTWDKSTTDGNDGCFDVNSNAKGGSCIYDAICPTGQNCDHGTCDTSAGSGGTTSQYQGTTNGGNPGGTIQQGYDCTSNPSGCVSGTVCSTNQWNQSVCCPQGEAWGNDPAHPEQGTCVPTSPTGETTNGGSSLTATSACSSATNYNDCANLALLKNPSSYTAHDTCVWSPAKNSCLDTYSSPDNSTCSYSHECQSSNCSNGVCLSSGSGGTTLNYANISPTPESSSQYIPQGYSCAQDPSGCESPNVCNTNAYGQSVCCPVGYEWGFSGQCEPKQTSEQNGPNTTTQTGDCALTDASRNPYGRGDYCDPSSGSQAYYHLCGNRKITGYCGAGQRCDASINQCVTDTTNSGGTTLNYAGTGSSGGGATASDCWAAGTNEQLCDNLYYNQGAPCSWDSGLCRVIGTTPSGYGCTVDSVCSSGICNIYPGYNSGACQ